MTDKANVVHNDASLLDKMMSDMRAAPSLYRPTNYWDTYEPHTMKYLKKKGLENFRSYCTGTLASFGAGTARSMLLRERYKKLADYKGLGNSSIRATLFRIYGEMFNRLGNKFDLLNIQKVFVNEKYHLDDFHERQELQYRYSKLMDTVSGLDILDSIEDSSIGNPYDLFRINQKQYTLPFLRYFDQMAYTNTNIDLSNINTVIEIGSGYGGLCEVYLKSFPHITYFNFEIPPQLYVLQQYLSAVFPGQVYGYENFLSNENIDLGKHRIFCLPTWALESMPEINFDLFINSGSFHEMELDVVKNYYAVIKEKVNYVYLFQLIHGIYKKTSERSGGCVDPIKLEDSISIFKDFDVLNRDVHYRVHHPIAHLIMKRRESS